jgi:precorrin-6Y C5,15-methyltransferase (decarboxylating)
MMNYLKETLARGEDVVLLGSGDPLYFGIGKRALREFGPERVEILPDLSSMQVAMARAGIAWDDAFFMSLHGGPVEGQRRNLPYGLDHLPAILQRHRKVVILTDSEYNPARIARALVDKLTFEVDYYVCQRMGYPEEKVERLGLKEASEKEFLEPNLVVIVKRDAHYEDVVFGLEEDSILCREGMITKDEIRAVSIHKLRIPTEGVLWDIGAGSGSIGLEAARMSPFLRAYAIEKAPEAVKLIMKNRDRFGAYNLEVVEGYAPEALEGLPEPQRVFIGGTGGRLSEILKVVSERMVQGVVVMNLTRLEALTEAMALLKEEGFRVDLTEVTVSKGKELGGLTHLQGLNPVFVLRGTR